MNCFHITPSSLSTHTHTPNTDNPPNSYWMQVLKQIMTGHLPHLLTFTDLLYCWNLLLAYLKITRCLHCMLNPYVCVCVWKRKSVNPGVEAASHLVINATAIGFPHKEKRCNSLSILSYLPRCFGTTPLLFPLLPPRFSIHPHPPPRCRSTHDPERCYRSI